MQENRLQLRDRALVVSISCSSFPPSSQPAMDTSTMDDVEKLQYFSLVSKICTELDNHYKLNDQDLAEFIINLADQANYDFEKFKNLLKENDADFADSFVASLLRLIQHMIPKEKKDEE